MMKKRLLPLLLAALLLLCGCEGPSSDPATGEPTAPVSTTAPVGGPSAEKPADPSVTDDPGTEPPREHDYASIICYEPAAYDEREFFRGDASYSLNVSLPREWSFLKVSDTEYSILREGNVIGSVMYGTPPLTNEWETLEAKEKTNGDITLQISVEGNDAGEYRHRLYYFYERGGEEGEITVTVRYEEMSSFAVNKARSTFALDRASASPGLGIVTGAKAKESILALGNSFLFSGYSNLGSFLESMCAANGKDLQATVIARGMATVSTYAADTGVLSSIRNGAYGAVFLCGFYSDAEIEALATVAEACRASGTVLVLFPAHNESRNVVTNAQAAYPNAVLVDWKGEIDDLIAAGVDVNDLRHNDVHGHSKPLAGYVGAHMIYRAIFGELPENGVQYPLLQSQVDAYLGDYARTGTCFESDPNKIIIFGA